MSDFLPQGYSLPKAPSKYMKFGQGSTKFRILDMPILGYRYGGYWEDTKPVRVTMKDVAQTKGKEKVAHFWAMPVWNYNEKMVQILEIVQVTIMGPLQALIENSDWGNPREYDITITRKGEGKSDTVYSVTPSPAKPIAQEILKAYSEIYVNLNALFLGKDPFKKGDAPEAVKGSDETIEATDLPF